MLKYLLLALLVAVVSSLPHCCAPDEFEGELRIWDPVTKIRAFEFLSYDYHHKRLRVDIFEDEIAQNVTLRETIWIFETPQGYQDRFVSTKGVCTRTRVTLPFRKACVEDNHHELHHLTIGGFLHATLYRYRRETNIGDFLVSTEGCFPIEGRFLTHHSGVTTDAHIRYFNIRHGIGNPAVWIIPEHCATA